MTSTSARISAHSPSFSRRRTVDKPAYRSKGGIVVSQNRVAAAIGAELLKAGGNAVDAAIATGFAMGVVEPWMSGIGGVGGALVHDPSGKVEVFDFGGISPKVLDPADYPLVEGKASDMFGWPAVKDDRNLKGAKSVVVPGQPAGMAALHAAHGKMPWAELVAPATKLAAEGLVVDWYATVMIAAAFADLLADPGSKAWFLPNGVPPGQPLHNSGKMARLPNAKLSETLGQIAREGIAPFYRGEIAASITAEVQAGGGCLSRADFEAYDVKRMAPHVISYRGRAIHVIPELNGGPTLAAAFSQLPGIAPEDDASLFLGYADALDFAWRHRFGTLGHAGEARFAERSPTSTTHFSVVDRDGMSVALTQTLLTAFGARLTLPGTGIAMNNGINWFDPQPGSPNRIAPGVRMLGNFCPAIMKGKDRDGQEETITIGGAGGRKIIPAVFQLLALVEDRGLSLEEAFARPRLDHSAGKVIVADARLGEDVLAALEARHAIVTALPNVAPYPFTIASAVGRKGGVNCGVTDFEHPWSEAVGEDEV
ncbi:MAG: hypothetical protein FD175_1267 [Beijerinckiaceae bacterium]|nr:MAG: hypothetical protein FD175_1267 [Beijerinckiaceae bacterium]